MLHIRATSTYTETNRFGDSRSWSNSLEISGDSHEVIGFIDHFYDRLQLPGIGRSLQIENQWLGISSQLGKKKMNLLSE